MKRFNMDGSGELVPKKNGGWVQVNEFKRELKERTSELEQALKDSEGEVGRLNAEIELLVTRYQGDQSRAETAEAERNSALAVIDEIDTWWQAYQGALPALGDIIAKAGCVEGDDTKHAAMDLFDNRLGWSDGRNPYAPRELWAALGCALYGENDPRVLELRRPASTTEGE